MFDYPSLRFDVKENEPNLVNFEAMFADRTGAVFYSVFRANDLEAARASARAVARDNYLLLVVVAKRP